MITGLLEGFALFCCSCRDFSMTNIHFDKPNKVIISCLRCGREQNLVHNPKAPKTTKAERIRLKKRFELKN